MLNRHLRFRDVTLILAAFVLLLGAVGCAQKEEMVTAQERLLPGPEKSVHHRFRERPRALRGG